MPFEVPKLPELLLREMAIDWVANKIFSDLHIQPRSKEIIFAVFPGFKEMCQNTMVKQTLDSDAGLVFGFAQDKLPDQYVIVEVIKGLPPISYPIFRECRLLHKDQLPGLQGLIDRERLMKKFKSW